jgi:hypothetical protein
MGTVFVPRHTVAVLLLAFAAPSSFARDTSQWTNLEVLKPGQRIGVIQSNQKRVEGRFERVTESGITLRADQEVTVAQENVIRVYRKPRANRTVRAILGAAIGAVAGAILTATAGERFRNEGQDVAAGAWIGGGAAIGAGVGALTGGGYQTVYERSARH